MSLRSERSDRRSYKRKIYDSGMIIKEEFFYKNQKFVKINPKKVKEFLNKKLSS